MLPVMLTTKISDALPDKVSVLPPPRLMSFTHTTVTGPVTVVCVKDINLGGGKTLTLSGSASDIFVVNITGSISMGGGSRIRASGLPPSNVLYNVIGAGHNIVI